MFIVKLLKLWCLLSSLFNDCYGQSFPSTNEMLALQDLYVATGGPNWIYTESGLSGIPWSFNASSSTSNPCGTSTWYGLSCNYTGNVSTITQLYLYTTNLVGTLPTSIGLLSNILYLNLYNNYLTGTIPESVGDMTNCISFSLQHNYFTGQMPSSFGNLIHATTLLLSHNELSGSIPSSFGNMTMLSELYLYTNALNGTIPDSMGSLHNLQYFSIYENDISGTLPETLGNLKNLISFYAYDNLLTGSIPSCIGNLSSLTSLQLYDNQLTGSIPVSIGSMTSLTSIGVYETELSGSLPTSFCQLLSLSTVYLYTNQLTGSIPDCIGQLIHVTFFDIKENLLTGTIPSSFGNMLQNTGLEVDNNYLEGYIPESLCQLVLLTSLSTSVNRITGTIPSCFGNLTAMERLFLYDNSMTSTIPESLGAMTSANFVQLTDTLLTGTLPSSLGNWTKITYLDFNSNLLTGTIPDNYGLLPVITQLELNDNLLSGTIPTTISQSETMFNLLLYNNLLTGSIEQLFNSSKQLLLQTVYLNSNSLTGSVPDEAFMLPRLQALGLVSNCLYMTLSDVMCSNVNLTSLILDGIGTAAACQHKIFPHFHLNAYKLANRMEGSIPRCLFELPRLESLHLSGNDIRGSLPSLVNISSTLVNLSLSHNSLTGTISSVIQLHPWMSIDLSFNRLSGSLDSDYYMNINNRHNTDVSYQVNRLSGNIPSTLTQADNIHLVDGNLFSCGVVDRNSLPPQDPATNNYQCGSNAVDVPLYLFAAAVFSVLAVVLITFYLSLKWKSVGWLWYQTCVHSEIVPLKLLNKDLKAILECFTIITLVVLLLMLPTYGALTVYYSAYSSKYAWVLSAAYLSGVVPGALLLSLFVVILAMGVYLFQWKVIETKVESMKNNKVSDENGVSHIFKLFLAILANFAVIVGLNVLFVYVLLNSQSQFLNFVITIFTAVSKMVWNGLCLPLLFNRLLGDQAVHFSIRACLQLFNYIIVPLVVVAVTSPNCFYYIFVNAQPVNSVAEDYGCYLVETDGSCSEYAYFPLPTSYDPQFSYNYQCTSTLVTSYSSVFVYMFLLSGLVEPSIILLLQHLHTKYNLHCLRYFIPRLHRPPQEEELKFGRVIYGDKLALKFVTSLSLLLSFGVVFPLLSVVILVDTFSCVLFTQVSLGRLLSQDDSQLLMQYEQALSKSCVRVVDLLSSTLWIMIPLVGVFFSFFVWDIVGDAVGLTASLWAPCTMIALPIGYFWLVNVFHWYYTVKVRGVGEGELSGTEMYGKDVEVCADNPIIA